MRKKIFSFLLSLLMLTTVSSCSVEEPVMPVNNTSSAPLQKPDAGENYYGYVNFEYLTEGQIPYDKNGYGTFDSIQDQLEKDVSVIIDRCVENKSSGDKFEQAIGELYEQYFDTDTRDKVGIEPLKPILDKIENCKTTDELIEALGVMYQEYGVSSLFVLSPEPNIYDTSENQLYLKNFNTCGNMKENFTKTDRGSEDMGDLTQETLMALNVDVAEAKQRAKNVVHMVNEFMVASLGMEYMFDSEKHYSLYSKKEFDELFSNIDADKLLKAFGFQADEIVLYDESQAKKINEYFTDENLRELKDFSFLCIVFQYRSVLPPKYQEEITQNDDPNESAEKKAKTLVSEKLEEEIGILYGREICTDEVMTSARKMLDDIKKSCRQLIQKSDRLSEDSRKKLLSKLDNIIFLLGYNTDYESPFTIKPAKDGGNLLENSIAIQRGKMQNDKKKLSQKAERNTWDMTPVTVNAVYNPYVNTVTIPAVMLSNTSFNPSYGEYKNLGMLGYVIAHEMNHAFDSNGVNYDKNGCLNKKWISEKDQEEYKKIQDKAVDYYSNYKILDIYNIDGKQTLMENLADLGAVQCITNITNDKEQLKQIFEGVAVQWASLCPVKDVLRQLGDDEHSPSEARVNAVVSSTDKFYDVYEIKETDKMYTAPENRIKVW